MKKIIENSQEKATPLVCVVDDDESMREALQSLLKSVGFRTSVFPSANEFLNAREKSETDCLILDVRMPGLNGLELQEKLTAENSRIPVIFISAHSGGDERAKAIAAGAIEFLYKPFSEKALLDAVSVAFKSKSI